MKTFAKSTPVGVGFIIHNNSNLKSHITRIRPQALSANRSLSTLLERQQRVYCWGEITGTFNIARCVDSSITNHVYTSHINTENLKQTSMCIVSYFGNSTATSSWPRIHLQRTVSYRRRRIFLPISQQQFGPPLHTLQRASQGYIKSLRVWNLAIKRAAPEE